MNYQTASTLVLNECREAMSKVDEQKTQKFIEMVTTAEKVFFIGVGRVKMELEAIAKRLNHLGVSTHIVGDVNEPAMTDKDVLIVGSGSGESLVPVAKSSLAPITDLMIRIPVQTKLYLDDEIKSNQPMSSLFEQALLIWGDTVACMMVNQKKIELKKLWQYHANLE